MEDLSDRELEKFLQENIAGRWFCGFLLNEDTPDHTVFTRARTKIGTELLATLFQELRDQLKKQGFLGPVASQALSHRNKTGYVIYFKNLATRL